jgi:hypothetical protein
MIVIAIVAVIGVVGALEHRYTVDAEVTRVCNNVVFFTDDRGYTWSKNCDNKNYEIGENVKLVMHDSVTYSIIDDDSIIKVKK